MTIDPVIEQKLHARMAEAQVSRVKHNGKWFAELPGISGLIFWADGEDPATARRKLASLLLRFYLATTKGVQP